MLIILLQYACNVCHFSIWDDKHESNGRLRKFFPTIRHQVQNQSQSLRQESTRGKCRTFPAHPHGLMVWSTDAIHTAIQDVVMALT